MRSPAAYEAVKGLKILNLPSRRSLESLSGLESHPPGVSHHYLCEQWKNYQAHCEKLQREGHPMPVSEGVLIFDEVKVQNGVSLSPLLSLCLTFSLIFFHSLSSSHSLSLSPSSSNCLCAYVISSILGLLAY